MSDVGRSLEEARKELLDLGLRNPLINFRRLKARGIHVIDELPTEIFRILVTEGKSMSFLPVPDPEEADEADAEAPTPGEEDELLDQPEEDESEGPAARHIDSKLQTSHTSNRLQKRLLNTYYAARTYIEEQGVNVLYMALGMLEWYEAPSSTTMRRAPLILIPVELYRTSVQSRFRIRYTGDEVGDNLSLRAKLKADFGFDLPELPEDVDVAAYFDAVEKAIQEIDRWRVDREAIEVGFFSFGKFLMFRDLDTRSWPDTLSPDEHEVLRALLGEGFKPDPPSIDEDAHLDAHLAPHDVAHVVDADSTQILAMRDVLDGRNMIIQGPPGTGKSQTITNLIAEALGKGKSVLFVSEKMAALEVVKRRLDQVGLGDACLELHSHKTRKKDLLDELKRTLSLGQPKVPSHAEDLDLLKDVRDRLNAYSEAVNTPVGSSGVTPYQAYGHVLRLQRSVDIELPLLNQPGLADWDSTTYRRRLDLVKRVEAHLAVMGIPAEHPCRGTRRMAYLPSEERPLREALEALITATEELQQRAGQLASQLKLPAPETAAATDVLCRTARQALDRPPVTGVAVDPSDWVKRRKDAQQIITTGQRLQDILEAHAERIIPDAWTQEVLPIRTQLAAHGQKWWRFLIGEYRRARNQLAGLCRTKLPDGHEERLALVDAIMEVQRLRKQLEEAESTGTVLFGVHWQGEKSDWAVLAQVETWMVELHELISRGEVYPSLFTFLTGGPDLEAFREGIEAAEEALRKYAEAAETLEPLLDLDPTSRFGNDQLLQEQPFDVQRDVCRAFLDHLSRLQEIVAYNHLVKALREEELPAVVDLAETWPLAGKHLATTFEYARYNALIERAMKERLILGQFDGAAHRSDVDTFRQLDQATFQYNRARLAHQHWSQIPCTGLFGQMRVLNHEMQKKRRHLPIRQLMQQAGNAIQAIKPVFMMSPMSIATYLPPGSLTFDLVVFDEASQVKPVEAFGAILRGKQAVVVGDSKQLPPTSFFDTVTSDDFAGDEEDEAYAVRAGDVESILSLFASQGAPERMLRWHYRSRHDSLIAVSNREFYDSRLITFPSPDLERAELGLRYHYLPHTTYDRGGSRANRGEARAVAEAVMEHARTRPDWTLGVAAFSQAQTEAIQVQLERLRREDPSLEHFFNGHPEEPFFIKNLENVQGDERDVIFISIGYGRDEHGKLSLNFGPLNRDGGERRLNVLITRARRRCEVFTNLRADDIDLSRTNARGVACLKRYLQFAESGQMEMPEFTGGTAESPFETEVAEALRGLGYEVHHQIGSAGYFIDLAVVDPERPGRYLLGIECDGATYHSARSARDRDRIRQAVLEGLGWHIHRIWSTDWFRNPDRELKQVAEAIEAARARAKEPAEPVSRSEPPQPPQVERHDVEEGVTEHGMGLSEPYQEARLPRLRLYKSGLHEEPLQNLSKLLQMVVRVESPVHIDQAARRILEAYSVKSLGRRIRDHLQKAIRLAEMEKFLYTRGDFLYDPNQKYIPIRDRSNLDPQYKKLELVAPDEIDAAIEQVVFLSHGSVEEDLPNEACNLLGFSRVTVEMRGIVVACINHLVKRGRLIRQNGMIIASEAMRAAWERRLDARQHGTQQSPSTKP
ncbi:hypothetical protein AWN76_007990 [Rhodothermaceae bacterium RA]|nr:hypothetical protein AWN76_007990 [Rhodothermaceae bacterium RA]